MFTWWSLLWLTGRGETAAAGAVAMGTGTPHTSGRTLTHFCFCWTAISAPAIWEITGGRKRLLWIEEVGKSQLKSAFWGCAMSYLETLTTREGMSRFLCPLPLVSIKTNYFLAPVIELPRKKGKDVSGVISVLRLFLCALLVFFFFQVIHFLSLFSGVGRS